MKKIQEEKTIKRSDAARMLGKHPRTLLRFEQRGLLNPIRKHARQVTYLESEILAMAKSEKTGD